MVDSTRNNTGVGCFSYNWTFGNCITLWRVSHWSELHFHFVFGKSFVANLGLENGYIILVLRHVHQFSRQMTGQFFEIRNIRLLPHPFPFHINLSFDSYLVRATKSVIHKLPSSSFNQCTVAFLHPKLSPRDLASSILFFRLWLIILRLTKSINLFFFWPSLPSCFLWFPFYNSSWQFISWHSLDMSKPS
jgi:hypothetical protein